MDPALHRHPHRAFGMAVCFLVWPPPPALLGLGMRVREILTVHGGKGCYSKKDALDLPLSWKVYGSLGTIAKRRKLDHETNRFPGSSARPPRPRPLSLGTLARRGRGGRAAPGAGRRPAQAGRPGRPDGPAGPRASSTPCGRMGRSSSPATREIIPARRTAPSPMTFCTALAR